MFVHFLVAGLILLAILEGFVRETTEYDDYARKAAPREEAASFRDYAADPKEWKGGGVPAAARQKI